MSHKRNTNLWVTAACAAPLAHWSGIGWLAMVFAVAATAPLCMLPGRREYRSRPLCLMQWLWTTAVLGSLMQASGTYWPGGGKAVGLILLTLAAFAGTMPQRERAGNTLFWLLVPMGGLILLLSLGKMNIRWLTPTPAKWLGELLCILLVPALADRRSGGIRPGVTAILTAILIQGTLGSQTAMFMAAPLYETGRALGPGGEILVSVGMTLSWYAFAALLYGKALEFGKGAGIPAAWAPLTWALSGAMILFGVKIPGGILAAGSFVLWVILPFLSARKNN